MKTPTLLLFGILCTGYFGSTEAWWGDSSSRNDGYSQNQENFNNGYPRNNNRRNQGGRGQQTQRREREYFNEEDNCTEDDRVQHCLMDNVDHACKTGAPGQLFARYMNIGQCTRWNPTNDMEVRKSPYHCTACCNVDDHDFTIPNCKTLYLEQGFSKFTEVVNHEPGFRTTGDEHCDNRDLGRCRSYVNAQVEACSGNDFECIFGRIRYHPCKKCICKVIGC